MSKKSSTNVSKKAPTSSKRKKTKFIGVYQRQHSTRRHQGRPDICFDITYKDVCGKKRWEKVGWISEGYTATLASEVRAERLRIIRHSEIIPSIAQTNLSFAKAFHEFDQRHLYQLKTAQEDRRRFRSYLKSLHDKQLASITHLDLEDIKRKMANKNYSPQTIKHALSLVRRVFRKMDEWELFHGKTPRIEMPKVDASRTRFLKPKEADDLLNALKERSETWHAIALLSLKTGMRLGEILSLRFEDLDLDSKVLHLRDAKAGSRAVILSDDACEIFKTRLRPLGLVFPARGTGGKGISSGASKSFGLAVKDVGLNKGITDPRQKVVFHTLRHTFASWLAIKGVPLYTIGELLGHKSIEMTQRYSHLCPDSKRDAVNSIDDLL